MRTTALTPLLLMGLSLSSAMAADAVTVDAAGTVTVLGATPTAPAAGQVKIGGGTVAAGNATVTRTTQATASEVVRGDDPRLSLAPNANLLDNLDSTAFLLAVARGVANGVAALDAAAKVPVAQLPVGTASGVAGLDATGKVPVAQLPGGVANGVATLDGNGKVPTSQLPAGTGGGGSGNQLAITQVTADYTVQANDQYLEVYNAGPSVLTITLPDLPDTDNGRAYTFYLRNGDNSAFKAKIILPNMVSNSFLDASTTWVDLDRNAPSVTLVHWTLPSLPGQSFWTILNQRYNPYAKGSGFGSSGGQGNRLYTDGSGVGWLSGRPELVMSGSTAVLLNSEFTSGQVTSPIDENFILAASGTGAAAASVPSVAADEFGIIALSTGTTTTGRCALRAAQDCIFHGSAGLYFRARVRVPTLGGSGQPYVVRVGFQDSVQGDSVDGMYFRYNYAQNSGNWALVTRRAGVETVVDTLSAPAANTWTSLELKYDPSVGLSYGVGGPVSSVVSIPVANCPANGSAYEYSVNIIKTGGSTARTLDVDFVKIVYGSGNASR